MKKILITGINSYIGTSFEHWVRGRQGEYQINTISLKTSEWKEQSFASYDIIFHVAGIAHVDANDSTQEEQDTYYRVNRDLTIELARKAKEEGVKQLIFMSSIIVYGDNTNLGDTRIITRHTKPTPSNCYGDSKLQAEQAILPLQSDEFHVAILRAPMIYGKGSKGNYSRLAGLATKTRIFPKIQNQRSMLHIDNLCEFIRLIIDNDDSGIFYPQNEEYICTSELVRQIAAAHGKILHLTSAFNSLLFLFVPRRITNKMFGTLIYDKSMSQYKDKYCVRSYEETIQLTES
ncbi:MAG TPA: NAD-dependent epimerase/dehydratase family protein [Clostridiales bacterium]|nr:NAD-dependent epimerase/dehydratase family protein [Clostridiales bacterium]